MLNRVRAVQVFRKHGITAFRSFFIGIGQRVRGVNLRVFHPEVFNLLEQLPAFVHVRQADRQPYQRQQHKDAGEDVRCRIGLRLTVHTLRQK